jgi:DNA-binding MarR family transcriptional regulator
MPQSSCYGAFDFREFTLEVILHQQAIADKLGINLTDFKSLGLLHRKGAMTPKKLAKAMRMSAAAMTTVIDRLEKAGYAERKREGEDRRSLTVHAAPGSGRKVSNLYQSFRTASKGSLSEYSEEELVLISSYLSKATAVLRAATAKLS